jgi:hypothetical protein
MAAPAGISEIVVLRVVLACIISLPDVDSRSSDWLTARRKDATINDTGFPRRAAGDVITVLESRRAFDEERTEHRRLRCFVLYAVVETDHEHGSTENVRQEDELLAPLVGDTSDLGEKGDPVQPLVFRQLDVGDETVQVSDERVENDPKTVRLRTFEARSRSLREGLVSEIART